MRGGDIRQGELVGHEMYVNRGDVEVDTSENKLINLGFEEGEIEILLENIEFYEIMAKYMDIANDKPFNMNWTTEEEAINADYGIKVFNANGSEYTKHDIAKDVFNSYVHDQEMNAGKGRRKRITKKLKKEKRKTKKNRKKTRKNKLRLHRRHY
jgi:uncharacterized protein YktA (UPF0223 family)